MHSRELGLFLASRNVQNCVSDVHAADDQVADAPAVDLVWGDTAQVGIDDRLDYSPGDVDAHYACRDGAEF